MTAMLVFACALLVAVLLSGLAQRSVLSTAVLFLVTGVVVGRHALGLVTLHPSDPLVARFIELAVLAMLFTDGLEAQVRDARWSWWLAGRALFLGLPLTLLGVAVLARFVAGVPWAHALLLGAVLSPTDPVLAAAIVGREEIPLRLRRLLNVESGFNDGLALPLVVAFLAVAAANAVPWGRVAYEVVGGTALGVAVAWTVVRLEQTRWFKAVQVYRVLLGFVIALLVYSLSALLKVNAFLGSFAAGIATGALDEPLRREFRGFGEPLSELLKLAALMIFGTWISLPLLRQIAWPGYLFALLVLFVVRPVAMGLSFAGADLTRQEWVVAAWFGPKGFASVLFSILVLRAAIPGASGLFHLAALVIALSILAHSSTDVLVARWFDRGTPPPQETPLTPAPLQME